MALSFEVFLTLFMSAVILYYYEEADPNVKPRDVPQEEVERAYDFIIVGAGTAGCVVAHRLTELPEWSVLLIEAGGDETAFSNLPLLWIYLLNTDLDWNYTIVPQKYACGALNGMCQYPTGHVIGGSSSIHHLAYVRGVKEDYDDWGKLGNKGWNYREALKYFKKAEHVAEPELASSPYRGTNGPVNVQYSRYHTKLRKSFIKAGQELGWNYADYNGETQRNVIGRLQLTVKGPSRQSSSKAYLHPIRNRRNLAIIKRSFVLKILFSNYTAIGVEYTRQGRKYRVNARKEVILSAGALNSPKILMLSGIGPKNELKKHGIDIKLNLPVGRVLQDHVAAGVYFKLSRNVTITKDLWMTNKSVIEYARDRKGPLSSNGMEAISFINPDDPSGLPTISHIMFPNSLNVGDPEDRIMFIIASLLKPKSSGTVRLKSNDPYDIPVINPKFLSTESDYKTLYNGVKKIFEYMDTSAMRKYSPVLYMDKYTLCQNIPREKYIDCILKQYSLSFLHPVGTVRMGPANDPRAVVDENLLVRGISNLRVVDASIMPDIPRANTYAATIMIAEKASDIIKLCHRIAL